MTLTTPTILTLLRIALIPVFVVVFFLDFDGSNVFCTALFTLAALTDWFDGYLARRLGQASDFGAFLDPVADKLMVAAALVLLVYADDSPWVAASAVVIIGREITISALREWMARIGSRAAVAVSTVGKFKTTVQMIALVLLLYREPVLGVATLPLGRALLYVAAVLTLWSMFIYLGAAWSALRK
ncbi:CDP-diacylglycerol--glycerol-3-phosphate 3-phosphatidyltransferase/cardiolipin synthase [Plasticicumulans lactativorans]|uniref:CDP-diacylglycerol--glycerol-3-phosphate 3-phosphatidyltransferase n=1 Tax=Plasticicumulans lactativorans TaxID=1133106 RepID=A0A4R2LIS9_9GAMM|nr:CDP-diacylglycerol--glycerol-3-phosphate 3-phosphatidyltransferase [Plasticicumulans lactativorans]TCO83055.1 CDP-diacylglycerol--glycerol-3-phosphate 3-phosphatidyltransferase/cardiolipin synthase [Plasticicumulans lactativorans]